MENANKVIPEVEITLANKSYLIKASFKVLIAIHKATGKNPFKSEFMSDMNPTEMAQMLHCAVKTIDPEITLDFVEENMGGFHMKQVAKLVNALYENAMPDAEPEAEKAEGETEEKKPT